MDDEAGSWIMALFTSSTELPSPTQVALKPNSFLSESEEVWYIQWAATAAAASLQSCPTLCDPIDGSPPGSPVPGILQAGTLEWVAISFSNVWKWKVKVKSLSRVRLLATPWTAAHQALPSIGFSRQEHWSGVPLPSPTTMRPECKSANHVFRGLIMSSSTLLLPSKAFFSSLLSHQLCCQSLADMKQVIGSIAASTCLAGSILFLNGSFHGHPSHISSIASWLWRQGASRFPRFRSLNVQRVLFYFSERSGLSSFL